MNSRKLAVVLCAFALTAGLGVSATVLSEEGSMFGVQSSVAQSTQSSTNANVLNEPDHLSKTSVDLGDQNAEHAYDPFAELEEQEAEQAYRESTEYVEGKVLFTLRDWRDEGAKTGSYIDENSNLAKEFKLKDVEVVYEAKSTTAGEREGLVAWDVYYQASTKTDDIWALVDKLAASDDVVSAEPDFVWGTTAVGDPEPTAGEVANEWYLNDLGMPEAWDIATNNGEGKMPGEGVVVAVIDTGVDYTHPDLDDNIWTNAGEVAGNGVDDDGNGYIDDVHGIDLIEMDGDPMDDHGHGTHVAGIIAMEAGNGGGVGIAYGAKVMCIKAGQANGSFASTDIAKAVQYAAANGADVINMSFGGAGKSALVEAALADAFGTSVLVASAGNDGLPTTDAEIAGYLLSEDVYPAGYSYALGVMATDTSGDFASFSNWDYITGANCEYELAAPGVNVYSTLPNNRYASWSGTSMAAPTVAASAAIIRAKNPDKSVYTSRYIVGQLVGATQRNVTFSARLGDCHIYPTLNSADSLTIAPKPSLSIGEVYIFDGVDISEANNGDGIVQAGETVDLGIVVRNRWGIASDVQISADATSDGGVPNPYVTFINGTIDLQDIGTYMLVNNGFVYNNDLLIGASNPIRVKVSEDTPNDAQITVSFTCSARNGINANDSAAYGLSDNASFSFRVQKGQVLRGVINEDMTLTSDKYWIIDSEVVIDQGATVNINPGAHVQFWSSRSSAYYATPPIAKLIVRGSLFVNGTESEPVFLYPGKGFERYAVRIQDQESSGSSQNTVMHYVDIINPRVDIDSGDHLRAVQNTEYVIEGYYNGSGSVSYAEYPAGIGSKDFSKSLFREFVGRGSTKSFISGSLSECLVENSFADISSSDGDAVSIQDSVLRNPNNYKKGVFSNEWAYLRVTDKTLFSNNAILNPDDPSYFWKLVIASDQPADARFNYWGTENPDLISYYLADMNSIPTQYYSSILFEPILTLESSELESIYPFVTEAFVTDAEGNRLDAVAGSQNIQLHVRFNRDMASDIQPLVSFGGAEPYTDYIVNGDWSTAREWVGAMFINPFINLGTQYIRVKNAAAADDKWLLTGTDEARFSFKIEKVGAQSMTLQGSGAAGCNELTWVQDDYETLAGYNLYRTTSYDPDEALESQSFTRINASVITPDLDESGNVVDAITAFTDKDVEQGVDYYYYFTVVDTAFNESEASNVVRCTPLDLEVPAITHNAIASIAQGASIAVAASVTDNVSVEGVTLHYRMSGAEAWKSTPMRNTTGDTYQAVIGSYETEIGTLEYYIEATDGENTTLCGSPELPNIVAIVDPVTVTSLSLVPASANMQIGEDLQLTAAITPEGVTKPDLSWETSDIAVATVSPSGVVTAQGPGAAIITCTSGNGKSGTCAITVRKSSETTISAATVNAAPGETIEVPVAIAKNCGIAGMKLAVSYSADSLEYAGVEAGDLLQKATIYSGDAANGEVNVVWYTPKNVTQDGELFKLKFKVADGAELGGELPIALAYEPDDISDEEFNYLDVTTSAGSISVAAWLLGDVFEDGKVNIRDAILLQQYLTSLAGLSAHQMNLADLDANGSVDMSDMLALGKALVAAPSAGVSSFGGYSIASIGDASLEVVVGTGRLGADGTVALPVDFTVGGSGVSAFRFTLSYDSSSYKLTGVLAGDVLVGGSMMFNDLGDGTAIITWYNASRAATSGAAFTLTFERVGDNLRTASPVELAAQDGDVLAEGGGTCESAFTAGAIEPAMCVGSEDHVWNDGETTKDASCAEEGVTTYTCTICGAVRTESIPKIPHALQVVEAVEGTCIQHGVAAHWKCKECGATFADADGSQAVTSDDLDTGLAGHDYEGAVTNPTCTEEGFTTWTCAYCGDSYTNLRVAALGHMQGAAKIENEHDATWDEAGGYDKVVCCERCGTELSREHVDVPALSADPEQVSSKQVADAVAAINSIGVVETDENGDASEETAALIEAARSAYNALSDEQKAKVTNYAALQTAEKKLADDKAAAEKLASAREQSNSELRAARSTYTTVGTCFTSGKVIYKITKAGDGPEASALCAVSMKTVKIPAAIVYGKNSYMVTTVASKAFTADAKIGKLVIGDNVRSIGASAFAKCKKLKTATIGKSVSVVGKGAFKGCKKLKTVAVASSKLSKAALKNLVSGSKIKTIKLSGKDAKKMKKTYQKWLGKKVKVK